MHGGNQYRFTALPWQGLIQTSQAAISAETWGWEKPSKSGEVGFPKRRGRNGVSVQQVREVEMAACEDATGCTVLGLGEEPTLLQAAKAPRQKEVFDWLPFEPAWRISKDFRMKEVAGRLRGQEREIRRKQQCSSRQPFAQMAEYRQNESLKRRQRRGKPVHLPKTTKEQSDWERSVLQSSKAQHSFSGFALAARGV